MANLDPFSRQLAHFVRTLSDEALLELIRQKLDGASPGGARRSGSPGRGRPPGRSGRRASSEEREALLASVEAVVKGGAGVSVSDVARELSLPKPRAAAALKELKTAGRIAQGGDRRFARYAADAETAERASEAARSGAARSEGASSNSEKRSLRARKASKRSKGAGRVARAPARAKGRPGSAKKAPKKASRRTSKRTSKKAAKKRR